MNSVTIGRLAEQIGISTDTIRYYRDLGLLHPKRCENGYFEYMPSDALTVLYTRELRGNDLPLKTIRSSFENMKLDTYYNTLSENERRLSHDIEMMLLELERIRETQKYISCGMRLLRDGVTEVYEGSDTWTICTFDSEGFHDGSLMVWTENFPFSYVVIKISLDELQRRRGADPFLISVGCGALDKYVRRLNLPLGKYAVLHPAANYVRACITLRDPFSITSNDIRPLSDYAAAHALRFTDCIGARLLFIEDFYRCPLYYFMIWARVDTA